jgi:hypothetical protein
MESGSRGLDTLEQGGNGGPAAGIALPRERHALLPPGGGELPIQPPDKRVWEMVGCLGKGGGKGGAGA